MGDTSDERMDMADKGIPKIATRRPAPSMPEWAILERSLIALAKRYGEIYSARLRNCDTVTNMLSTSMVMDAYLYTGEEKYQQWVLDYVDGCLYG